MFTRKIKTFLSFPRIARTIFGAALFFVLINSVLGFAEEVSFEATVDRNTVSLGSGIILSLTFYGAQNIAAPELPEIDGFQSRYLGPSSRLSIVNGVTSSSITHNYTLVPLKEGSFTVPVLSITYKNQTYTSKPISITVVQGPVSLPQQEGGQEDHSQELSDRVFLTMELGKRKAYVNELIPVTIKLYVNKLAIKDIQMPTIEQKGFSLGEFRQPKQYQASINGIAYDVVEFNTTIFSLSPGEIKFGPARLECTMMVRKESRRRPSSIFDSDFFDTDIFGDFFGRYENYPLHLSSVDASVTIVPLPEEGRPGSFSGAVGDYSFELTASPTQVKVGDPITLTMSVRGEGNLKLVNAPRLDFGERFKVYEPQVTQDSDGKVFEQVVIPTEASVREIPEINFSFFDTQSATYKTITRGPIPITVTPLPQGQELKVLESSPQPSDEPHIQKESLGRDIIYIKDDPGPLRPKGKFLYNNILFLLLQLVPLGAIIAAAVISRRRQRLQTDVRYARYLRAPRAARKNLQAVHRLLAGRDTKGFYEAVFKTLQEYLGDRFHLSSAGITAAVVDDPALAALDRTTLDRLKECFNECDRARFGQSDVSIEQMHTTLTVLETVIERIETKG